MGLHAAVLAWLKKTLPAAFNLGGDPNFADISIKSQTVRPHCSLWCAYTCSKCVSCAQMSQEQKLDNTAVPESKSAAVPPPVVRLNAAEEALLAKFKIMFPELIKGRVEGGWERFILQNKFTDKDDASLRKTMQGIKIAMIKYAEQLRGDMAFLDHGYAMVQAEFARRGIKEDSNFALVVIRA